MKSNGKSNATRNIITILFIGLVERCVKVDTGMETCPY